MQVKGAPDYHFDEVVRASFKFLEDTFGFAVVRDEPSLVRYENATVFVEISHAIFEGYDIELMIGLLGAAYGAGIRWPMSALLRLHGVHLKAGQTSFQITSVSGVASSVPILAGYLKEYGPDALRGDPDEFRKLARQNDRDLADHQTQVVKQAALLAWEKRDYRRVVELFGSVLDRLSAAEKKKLEYSFKKLDT